MPTLHRLRVFRDDIVFFIYLYQRWIYPEDKNRIEVGSEFEDVTLEELQQAKAASQQQQAITNGQETAEPQVADSKED